MQAPTALIVVFFAMAASLSMTTSAAEPLIRVVVWDEQQPAQKSAYENFRHGQGQVMALTSYCNFAAIYRVSPVGLKLSERGVDDAQHAILQKIAWETVSAYPRAGL